MWSRILLLALVLALQGCTLGSRVPLSDGEVFPEKPTVVRKGDEFFLRYVRPRGESARPESVRCEVEGEHLLIYVPILVSAERESRVHPERDASTVYDYPLAIPSGLRHLEKLEGRVFWLDPNGTQHPIDVVSGLEAGVLPASSHGRQ